MTIGRDPHNDVVISSSSVSRRHATLQAGEDWVEIRDEGSTNGTFLNGSCLVEPKRLRPGDELRIGQQRFTVEEVAPQVPPVRPPVIHSPLPGADRPLVGAGRPSRRFALLPTLCVGALVVVMAIALTMLISRPLQPDEAARVWVEALAAQDVGQLSDLTCMEQQNAIQATSLIVGVGNLLGTSVDVGGLQYQTTRSDGSTANVQVSATIKAAFGPLATVRRLNLNLLMRREGGKWRYCDNVQRVADQIRQ